MSDTRCDGFNILMWPLVTTVAVSCFPWYNEVLGYDISVDAERWIMQGLTIFVTIAHLHYGQGVVSCKELQNKFVLLCLRKNLLTGTRNVQSL